MSMRELTASASKRVETADKMLVLRQKGLRLKEKEFELAQDKANMASILADTTTLVAKEFIALKQRMALQKLKAQLSQSTNATVADASDASAERGRLLKSSDLLTSLQGSSSE